MYIEVENSFLLHHELDYRWAMNRYWLCYSFIK